MSIQSNETDSKTLASPLKVFAVRFKPNQDLLKELETFVRENNLQAAFIMTCVGSLTKATLRMAHNGQETNEVIEILSKRIQIKIF